VEDWLKNRNDKELMIMSDYHLHTWTIAAGMFGKINNHNNNVLQYILEWCHSNSNSNCYDCDAKIAEQYFYKTSNYIQYYRAGKKLDNSIPFPDLSVIHCNFVGNISPINKYYNDLQLEKEYPFLSKIYVLNNITKFIYKPWECHFKNNESMCFLIWEGDDFIITVDPKTLSGIGTCKTMNGDGRKLLKLNTHIQILWEGRKNLEAYMPNENTISVKHGNKWYNFNKVETPDNFSEKVNLNKNNIFPLSYSIPRDCIKPVNLKLKTKEFATVVPGKSDTYIFKNSSKDYNEDYEKSKFAFTYKKGGWDCLRHYEILCNNCLPLFLDIDKCPEMTMHNFPKAIMKNILSDYEKGAIDNTKYTKYVNELHDYTLKHLTCETQADYLLNILKRYKNLDNPKILMITSGLLNYSTSTIAYGLRKKLNTDFIDYPKIRYIYKSNTKEVFNISLLEDDVIDRNDINNKIKNKYFDFVIFGAIGPDEPDLLDKINECSNYNSNEKIFIFGGDRPYNINVENKTSNVLVKYSNMGLCFIRELDDNSDYYFDGTWREYVREWTDISKKKITLTESYKKSLFIPNIKIDLLSKKTDLCEIGRKYDTDKSAWRDNVNNRRHCHPYTPIYEILFNESKNYSLNIMEIGIAFGSSLLMWREYFESSNIYALEYRKDHIEDFRTKFDNSRITIDEVDVRKKSSILNAFSKYQHMFDIIIDDSTHEFKDQVLIIKTVIPFLKPGGILIIEDIFKNIEDMEFLTKIKDELKYFKEYYFIEPEHINRNSYNWNNDKLLVLVKKGGSSLFEKYNTLLNLK
jgi:predicted O-methyltransferase YrrM